MLDAIFNYMGNISLNLFDKIEDIYLTGAKIVTFHQWLTVENPTEENKEFIVAKGDDPREERIKKVTDAFLSILKQEKFSDVEIEDWLKTCHHVIASDIRDDAVFVNRRAGWLAMSKNLGLNADSTEGCRDLTKRFLHGFAAVARLFTPEAYIASNISETVANTVYTFLSNRFPREKGSDFQEIARYYSLICLWAKEWKISLTSTDKLTRIPSLDDLARYIFSYLGIKIEKNAGSNVNSLLKSIKQKNHKSSVTIKLEDLRQNGSKTAIGINDLIYLEARAFEQIHKCLEKSFEKGQREYLNAIIIPTCKKIGLPLHEDHIIAGQTRHFVINALIEATLRWVMHIKNTAARDYERHTLLAEGNAELAKIKKTTCKLLDDFRNKKTVETKPKNEYEIHDREIKGYKKFHDYLKNDKCKASDEREPTLKKFKHETKSSQQGSIDFLEFLCKSNIDLTKDLTPKDLRNYACARRKLYAATHLKSHMIHHFHEYLSPATLHFGTCRMSVNHYALKEPNSPEKLQLIELPLFNGKKFVLKEVYWDSKQLKRQLAHGNDETIPQVPIATHNGLLCVGLQPDTDVRVSGLYAEHTKWPVSISPPREQLQKLWDFRNSSDYTETEFLNRLRKSKWSIDYVIKVRHGDTPFGRFAVAKNDEADENGDPTRILPNRFMRNSLYYIDPSWNLENTAILSIDLGLRKAACGTFLHVVSDKQLEQLCNEYGLNPPDENIRFLEVKCKNDGELNGKTRTYFLRRIGPDNFSDGTKNHRIWCLIGDQFPIKLDGESKGDLRELTEEEMIFLNTMDILLGIPEPYLQNLVWMTGYGLEGSPENQQNRLRSILRSTDVKMPTPEEVANPDNTCRRKPSRDAIAELGQLSYRLSYAIGRMFKLAKVPAHLKDESLDVAVKGVREFLEVCETQNIVGQLARNLRDKLIKTLPDYNEALLGPEPKNLPFKQKNERKNQRCETLAKSLRKCDPDEIDAAFKDGLSEVEKKLNNVMNLLHMRLFPQFTGTSIKHLAFKDMGGLSLLRIDILSDFIYKVKRRLVQYRALQETDWDRDLSLKILNKKHAAKKEIQYLQSLKNHRKCSLINAMISRALRGPKIATKKKASGIIGEILNSQFCPFLVVENLDTLRVNLNRTVRENQIIFKLCPGNFASELRYKCKLYGIMLVEVNPAYTSLTDSRTGDLGVRAKAISGIVFKETGWIQDFVAAARERAKKGNEPLSQEDRLFLASDDKLNNLPPGTSLKKQIVYVPWQGGPFFVSSNKESTRIIDADFNGSTSIGIKALQVPDFVLSHPKVLTDGNTVPDKVKYNKIKSIPKGKPLIKGYKGENSTEEEPKNNNERFYLWRKPSCEPIDSRSHWLRTWDFFESVKKDAFDYLIKKMESKKSGWPDDP
jgi:IS605 OrfB family transposase